VYRQAEEVLPGNRLIRLLDVWGFRQLLMIENPGEKKTLAQCALCQWRHNQIVQVSGSEASLNVLPDAMHPTVAYS
jgi:hypothetical protein